MMRRKIGWGIVALLGAVFVVACGLDIGWLDMLVVASTAVGIAGAIFLAVGLISHG